MDPAELKKDFGKEITFVVTLKPTFDDFQYVNQSPFVSLSTGQGSQFWLEVKNTGTKIWQKSGTAPVRLATANPRDRVSPFINSNRILMDKDTVNPGEIVRFTFNVTAPREAKIYKEKGVHKKRVFSTRNRPFWIGAKRPISALGPLAPPLWYNRP